MDPNYPFDEIRANIENTLLNNTHHRRRELGERLIEVIAEYPIEEERIERMPIHNSALTGMNWVQELLNGHPKRIHEQLRMSAPIFLRLCSVLKDNYGLRDSQRMNHIESVAIFMFLISQGSGYRQATERFQRSNATISKKFHEVLDAFNLFTIDEIRANVNADVHPHIRNNNMYYPHFKNCIGGIDGTHIKVTLPTNKMLPFISRKGTASQNVVGVCDFNMCFTFVSTGWEGSMHDSRILGTILQNQERYNFPVPPEGKYYLVDSGYTNMKGYLAPYKGERYHLPDFRRFDPRTANEMFNKHHASLRSVIERTFGVWKKRFAMLDRMPCFDFNEQAQIVAVTMAIHNFIRRSYTNTELFEQDVPGNESNEDNEDNLDNGASSSSTQQMRADSYMENVRNEIRYSICGTGE